MAKAKINFEFDEKSLGNAKAFVCHQSPFGDELLGGVIAVNSL